MRAVVSLVLLYLFIGVVVVGIQVTTTPCDAPLVMDAGHTNLTSRLDGTLFGSDNAVRLRLAKDVALWLPRMFEFVVQRDMSFSSFLNAVDCRLPATF